MAKDDKIFKYGKTWPALMHPAAIELHMIRGGGQFMWKNVKVGLGLFHHYKALQDILWPGKPWHRWRLLTLECFVKYRFTGICGAASSGKSHDAALFGLCMYYVFSDCCTVIVTSTTLKDLRRRIWSEITKHHKEALDRVDWLPGYVIESREQIVSRTTKAGEARDLRNGIQAIPTKIGNQWVGISALVGIKNKRVLLIGDELSLMQEGYLDSIANLNKNPGFQCIGLGNLKEATDPLGKLCEPSIEQGGWDGGIDQVGGTKTWPTRFDNGICIQLVGTDSPNFDVPETEPAPYPFLITREAIANDVKFYGTDSWQYKMMNEARLPRGQGSRRVITRQICLTHQALEQPIWRDTERTLVASLDAAYRGVGGDRCVLMFSEFGTGVVPDGMDLVLFALLETIIVPIKGDVGSLSPEDQIADFVKDHCIARGVPPRQFFFDSTGRGSLMASFAQRWDAYVQPVEFGGRGSERTVSNEDSTLCCDYYDRFVTELWWTSRLCVISGQCRGMTEEVMNEGCQREWKITPGNKVSVETKDEMRKKMGRSPDLYDCFVTGIEGARRLGFQVAKLSRLTRPGQEQWKEDLRRRARELREHGQLNYSV
jgi:hypothetical protein